jgi:histidinol-phosphatase (PHP family)
MSKRYRADYHVHSNHSPDCKVPLRTLCETAVQKGFREIAVTDHFECYTPGHPVGYFTPTYVDKIFADIEKTQQEFEGQLIIRKGLELGQPTVNPETAQAILGSYPFDYVIGSIHKVGNLSLSNVAYNAHNIENICLNYLDMLYELADEGDFDCLGHIDMIRLYAAKQGTPLNILEYEDQLVPVLRRVIERGKGIEINTTGFRQELSTTLPGLDVLKLYRELGGQILTIGSDAHRSADIGSGWSEAAILAKQAGFDYVTLYEKRKPILIQIE